MLDQFNINAELSFIGSWFLADPTVCDRLIEHFESSKDVREGEVIKQGTSAIVKEVKYSLDLPLNPNDAVSQEYAIQLQNVVEEYTKKYPHSANTARWDIEAVNLQKYPPTGGYFSWHFERVSAEYPDAYRHLVFMTYLNDIEDQGETEFFYQKIKIKPKKGLTLIWPADWTHTHRGIPSSTETKYIATGWFQFLKPN